MTGPQALGSSAVTANPCFLGLKEPTATCPSPLLSDVDRFSLPLRGQTWPFISTSGPMCEVSVGPVTRVSPAPAPMTVLLQTGASQSSAFSRLDVHLMCGQRALERRLGHRRFYQPGGFMKLEGTWPGEGTVVDNGPMSPHNQSPHL